MSVLANRIYFHPYTLYTSFATTNKLYNAQKLSSSRAATMLA